jgi:hypothetical protein
VKYLAWTARVFGGVRDHLMQAVNYANWTNAIAGVAGWLVTATAWMWLVWRSRAHRPVFVLLAAWIPVFLFVPAFSGGYLWHANLVIAGYAILFGVAFSWVIDHLPGPTVKIASAVGVATVLILLARRDVNAFLNGGYRSEVYRLNYNALKRPPVPREKLSGPALVYVEDRMRLGAWSYGAGRDLFPLVYLNREIEQRVIPPLDDKSAAVCLPWLERPRSFYFVYDGGFRWADATEQFRRHCEDLTGGRR